MNSNVQQAGLERSSRAGNAQESSLQERLVASLAAWFSRCDEDRIYF
ncbi:hypothetical protein GALL_174850 [mine drainage metagenome]|uniref:Uncharacterized protein n=1 Tax=mine drainage metagenome TaxID=410659 RepID=A0A1J5SFE7_9ZZZZ